MVTRMGGGRGRDRSGVWAWHVHTAIFKIKCLFIIIKIFFKKTWTVHGVIKDGGLWVSPFTWEGKGQYMRKWTSCSLTRWSVEFEPHGFSEDFGFGLIQFTSGTCWFQSFPCSSQIGSRMNLALFNCLWYEALSSVHCVAAQIVEIPC